ncbi:hypothetical protein VFPPC_18112 [Pochonia chlamydosporia 170]|uniref:Uncharacterized protein n=1 Tax=Pochonia chlamydosporia 170 TaxID=1380566 RepID=A0A219AQ09_METCM|nr:hypothetical protein VFPPC_18112 [Pochonia chlamydosporia 170]OWT42699.1 hypothetical protein VFPPC_18112 [Pochonia chlamydosporia 170]
MCFFCLRESHLIHCPANLRNLRAQRSRFRPELNTDSVETLVEMFQAEEKLQSRHTPIIVSSSLSGLGPSIVAF